MTVRRGTSNANARGSSYQRAIRRQWLVSNFGDGHLVHCTHCDMVLTVDNVSADRIIPGAEGGTYRRENLQPSCGECNSITGGRLGATRKAARRQKGDTDGTEPDRNPVVRVRVGRPVPVGGVRG